MITERKCCGTFGGSGHRKWCTTSELERGNQAQRITQLESVLRRLLEVDFSVPSELDGDASCFYCSAYLQGGEEHDKACAYLEAKKILIDTGGAGE